MSTPHELSMSLVAACRANDEVAARRLLDGGADPNASAPLDPPFQDSKGSALYWAAAVHGNLDLARLLIHAGAVSSNPPDVESLYHCVERDDVELTRLVLSVCHSRPWVSYCILAQLDREFPAGVKLFLDAGADLGHVHPQTGQTALHWAVKRNRSVEIVELLLSSGARVDARDLQGLSPFEMAVLYGHTAAADALDARGGGSTSPILELFRAASSEATFASALKSLGGRAPAFAPVHHAAAVYLVQHGRTEVLERVLSVGLSPNVRNENGHTALHWACLLGRPEVVELLLRYGADGAARDGEHDGTPAGWVAWASRFAREAPAAGYVRCIEVLAAAGCPMPPGDMGDPEVVSAIRRHHPA